MILLGNYFSTPVNQVPQWNVRSTAKTLVIHFDQERFEQLLSGEVAQVLYMCANTGRLAQLEPSNYLLEVSLYWDKILCEPIIASREAKQTLFESNTVLTETNLALR